MQWWHKYSVILLANTIVHIHKPMLVVCLCSPSPLCALHVNSFVILIAFWIVVALPFFFSFLDISPRKFGPFNTPNVSETNSTLTILPRKKQTNVAYENFHKKYWYFKFFMVRIDAHDLLKSMQIHFLRRKNAEIKGLGKLATLLIFSTFFFLLSADVNLSNVH